MWNAEIATFWRAYVPPCRPSRKDLDLCSAVLREQRKALDRRARVLILGSTTEFRDWAYEEQVETVVVDNSREYHEAVSLELTHRNGREEVEIVDWLDMTFESEFDIAVGDLVVGNVGTHCLPRFLDRVATALRPGGDFVTKSFFRSGDENASPGEVLAKLRELSEFVDPFPAIAYELTIACMEPGSDYLNFETMFRHIRLAAESGVVSAWQFERYCEFGWDSAMKFNFSVPTYDEWRTAFEVRFKERHKFAVPPAGLSEMRPFVLQARPST